MSSSVGNEGDKVHVLALFASQQTVNGLYYHFNDVDILPLVETADVVSVGNLSLVENKVYGTGMVFHEQPVAHILTLAIYGQRLAMADVVDKERYQFLRELIRTIVVRAVCHYHGHSVSIVEGTYKVVARRLRCRIW